METMKTIKVFVPVAAALLFAASAAAQESEEARAEAAMQAEVERARAEEASVLHATEAREAEVARRLEEAERKMAEAAREIAELTSERLPKLEEMERRVEFINSDKPRLGVTIGDEKGSGPVEGVRIMAVTPGSAAEEAGLRAGDVLTSVNDESLSADGADEAARLLVDFMEGVKAGDVLKVEYLRDGKVGSVEVEPRPVEMRAYSFFGMPKDFKMPNVPEIHVAPDDVDRLVNRFEFRWLGNAWGDMELVELSEGLGKYFGADSGVLVVRAPESDALQLEDGDVIRSIDGREPTSVKHALRILSSYQPGEKLELEIMRDKRKRTLDIEVPDNRSSMLPPAPLPARPAAAPAPAPRPVGEIERT
jgi:C-terminal processing protease CtpA/Prc